MFKITDFNPHLLHFGQYEQCAGLRAPSGLPDIHRSYTGSKGTANFQIDIRVFLGIITQQDELEFRIKPIML